MTDDEFLAARFSEHRGHLRAVAYRMLGSVSEADDAVQEAWLRLHRTDASDIENLGGWLTTTVARVALNLLRARDTRREQPWDTHVPDPLVSADPAEGALLSDSVGLALLVVLDTLPPAERLAFVLHDMFAVPFDEIAPLVGRSAVATRQLASRGRRRVQGAATPDRDLARQRRVVDAFLAAARGGDFDALVAVLDPDVVLRSDAGAGAGPGGGSRLVRGADEVAGRALLFAGVAESAEPVVVNGAAGIVAARDGHAYSVMSFTVVGGLIVEINVLTDPDRLRDLPLPLGGA